MKNIWSSINAEAWARDFCYIEYERMCKTVGMTPQSCQTYNALCKVFAEDMERRQEDYDGDSYEIL